MADLHRPFADAKAVDRTQGHIAGLTVGSLVGELVSRVIGGRVS